MFSERTGRYRGGSNEVLECRSIALSPEWTRVAGSGFRRSGERSQISRFRDQKKVIDDSRDNLITVSTVKSALLRYGERRRNSGG